ncbi:putative cytochrome P450 [Gordonia amicalis NBRC 100051 = JCM 11271]|nr:putative cytochrome P450 [Gordonia amicalis NBRC 100051 = JCM 11271]
MSKRKKQIQGALGKVSSMYPSKERPLAVPPAGSDLKPVMGDPGIPYLATPSRRSRTR